LITDLWRGYHNVILWECTLRNLSKLASQSEDRHFPKEIGRLNR
jgi:hypothetical protein